MLLRRISLLAAVIVLSLSSIAALADPLPNSNTRLNNPLDQPLAQAPTGARRRGQGFDKERFMEQLNLTEDQRQKIQEIRQKYQGEIDQRRETLHAAHQELGDMMAGTDSADAIRTKHQEVIKLRQELGNLRFESMLEIREVLTPEQRNQFAQMMRQHRENWRNRARNRGNRGRFQP
ncbi:MAG: Spy/CpxP family protein refolding chaperone [Xenococcaceae cyanobacterium]